MDNTFIPKAMEIITQAVVCDNNDELEKALSLYKQGLNYFITGLKYVKNEKSKIAIREKTSQYMIRAEEIKVALDKKNAKSVVNAGGGVSDGPKKKRAESGGGGGKGGEGEGKDDDEEDPDTKKLQDALMGAIVIEKPNVHWDDVAGLEGAKKLLNEAVILPVKFPQLFTGKVKPWKGILLYGPPGTGKSYIAKAVATEAGSSCFIPVSSSDLVSKYQGESERLVKNLFEIARKKQPSIIFIDEVDSLCGARGEGENESARRIKTEFLVQMEGVGNKNTGVLVLGATNTPWELDPAIRRRFEKRVYIPLPDASARQRMFKIHIGNTPTNMKEKDFKKMASLTDGYSGADLSILVREALYAPVRKCQEGTHFKKIDDPEKKQDFLYTPCSPGDAGATEMTLYSIDGEKLMPPVAELRDFELAQKNTKPSVGPTDMVKHEEWTKQFGQDG